MYYKEIINISNTLKDFSFKVFLFIWILMSFYDAKSQCNLDMVKNKDSTNHFISFGFMPGGAGWSKTPGFTYLKLGANVSYSYFIRNNISILSELNYYYGKASWNAFYRKDMFNVNLIGRYYLERFHFDVGYHLGNFLEYKAQSSSVAPPNLLSYLSGGLGMSFALKNKLVFDITARNLFNINKGINYDIYNPIEIFFSLGYVIKGANKRFAKPTDRLRVNQILKKGVFYTGFSIGPSFIYKNKITDLNISSTVGVRYFPKDKLSFGAYLLPSIYWSRSDSVTIGNEKFLPRKLNTIDVMLDARYHFARFLFVGLSARIGSYSNYSDWTKFDRKINLKFGPQYGFYLRLNNKWLLEFTRTLYFSLPKLTDKNSPKTGFFSSEMKFVRTLNYDLFKPQQH